jgi:hypothetical protein
VEMQPTGSYYCCYSYYSGERDSRHDTNLRAPSF